VQLLHARISPPSNPGAGRVFLLWRTTPFTRVNRSAGFSLLEMVMVIALIMIMGAIAIPTLRSSRRTYHLGQSSTTIAGAVQAARYQAIMTGCPQTITIPQTNAAFSNTTYQLVKQKPNTANPPVCAADTTDTIPWSTSNDVSLTAAVTMQFNPNGLMQVTAGTLPMVLSNTYTTNTITVSGAGNVKTTSP